MLECNIDDMNPEIYSYLFDYFFEQGAKDVFLTPIQMKKNRPGILLSLLVSKDKEKDFQRLLFEETTTLGVRKRGVQRVALERQEAIEETPFGKIRVKEAKLEGKIIRRTAEYEDLKKIAKEKKIPLQELYKLIKD